MSVGEQKELGMHDLVYYVLSHNIEDEFHRLTNGERLTYLWDEFMYCTLTIYDSEHVSNIPHNLVERSSTPHGMVFHINIRYKDRIYVYDICKSDTDSISIDYGVEHIKKMTVIKPKGVKIFSVMDYALKLVYLNKEDSKDE